MLTIVHFAGWFQLVNAIAIEKNNELEELITFLQDTISGNDNYQKERDRIKQKVFENTDSNNCYRVYKKLVQEGVLRIAQKEKLK